MTLTFRAHVDSDALIAGDAPVYDDEPFHASLICTASGQPKPLLANVLTLLRTSPEWRGVIAYDRFGMRTMALRPPPWEAGRNIVFEPRPWSPLDDVLATNMVQHAGIAVSVEVVQVAVETVGQDNPFHPVADYLDGLRWDGVARIGSWITDYLGGQQNRFTEAVGRKFLISAVARIRRPGCKSDAMMVAEGPQGIGKSSAFKVMGGPWYSDEIADFGSKDAALQMRSCWIMEVPELDAMNRSEVTRIKAFLSRGTDRFRPPYGRRVIEAPRECVLVGTTNADAYLKDETGGRRFWPIPVGTIDLDGLADARDQLWAEAAVAYRSGESWWLDDAALIEDAANIQADRLVQDPWVNRIEAHVSAGATDVSVGQILETVIDMKACQWTQVEQNRVARILRSLGFVRYQKRDGEGRQWRYKR